MIHILKFRVLNSCQEELKIYSTISEFLLRKIYNNESLTNISSGHRICIFQKVRYFYSSIHDTFITLPAEKLKTGVLCKCKRNVCAHCQNVMFVLIVTLAVEMSRFLYIFAFTWMKFFSKARTYSLIFFSLVNSTTRIIWGQTWRI